MTTRIDKLFGLLANQVVGVHKHRGLLKLIKKAGKNFSLLPKCVPTPKAMLRWELKITKLLIA